MSYLSNGQKAVYAALADNVYWDIRHGMEIIEYKDTKKIVWLHKEENINWTPIPKGWDVIAQVSGIDKFAYAESRDKIDFTNLARDGFTARVFQKGNEIVISYAGTDMFSYKDWFYGNVPSTLGKSSPQLTYAAELYQKIKNEYPNADIKFTGHSLGGGIASVMGVWFDKEAIVFDPAPFQQSVLNDGSFDLPSVKQALILAGLTVVSNTVGGSLSLSTLLSESALKTAKDNLYKLLDTSDIKSIDNSFLEYTPEKLNSRISKINATAVKGEILENYLRTVSDWVVENEHILTGETSIGSATKHSQTMLLAALRDSNFEHYTTLKNDNGANKDTLKFIFDENLYGFNLSESKQNFLIKLVRSDIEGTDYFSQSADGWQINKPSQHSLLKGFSEDLKIAADKFQPFVLKGMDKFVKAGYDAVVTQTIEWHYHQDIKTYDGAKFINTEQNAIQFTTAKADGLLTKAYNEFKDSINNTLQYLEDLVQQAWNNITNNKNSITYEYEQYTIATEENNSKEIVALDKDKTQALITLINGIKFKGGDKDDILFGYNSDDVLNGGKGNDRLIGGNGHDTYIINGSDTIVDIDKRGEIQFEGFAAEKISLKSSDGVVWRTEIDENNHPQKWHSATREGKDLLLIQMDLNSDKDKVLIKNFFDKNNIDVTKRYTGLNIELLPKEAEGEIENEAYIISNYQIAAVINTGDVNKDLDVKTSNRADIVFGGNNGLNIKTLEGGDLVIGSTQADKIHAGDGDDVVYGQSPGYEYKPEDKSAKTDHDIIHGGKGNNLIMGLLGNDTIYASDANGYLIKEFSLDRNWVLGGGGNDTVYGAAGNDFLQGGSGFDVVISGAGDDVVLGDGNLQFGYESKSVYEKSVEYTNQYGKWQAQNQPTTRERKPESFEWEAKLNNDKTDYELTTKIETRNDEHIVKYDAKINFSDVLYGGLGNDLLIGQYGNDFLYGEEGDDVLYGDDNRDESIKGNDYLSGGAGNDKLIGGKGEDILVGGAGSDEYVFRISDFDAEKTIIDEDNLGKIIIDNQNLANFTWEAVENEADKYTNSQGLLLMQTGAGLIITNNQNINIKVEVNTEDENNREILGIKLPEKVEEPEEENQPTPPVPPPPSEPPPEEEKPVAPPETKPNDPVDNQIPELKPKDGQKLITINSLHTTGTFGDDFITPNIENINKPLTINSLTGNDTVTGSNANDIIRLGAGNDIIQAGKGNDYIDGGIGNDTYIYNKGDGHDTVFDMAGNDKLLLGSGITAQNILLEKTGLFGMDLTINILDFNSNNQAVKTNDKVTVQGYFAMPNQKIEELQLSSGEKLVGENINNLAYKTDNISLDKFKDNDFLNEVNNYWVI